MENKVELKCGTCKNYNKYCCMWNEAYCDPEEEICSHYEVNEEDFLI